MRCRDNLQLQGDRRQQLAGNIDAPPHVAAAPALAFPLAIAPPPRALPIGWDAAGACAGDGDRRDEIDNVAQRMRDRNKDKGSDDDDESDNEGSGSDEASVSMPPPPKRKKGPASRPPKGKNGKTGNKGKKQVSASPPPKAKLGSWPTPPKIGWERSRFQVMCRTGQGGAGSSLKIPFEGNGGSKGAWAKAKAWLHDRKQEYKKHRA
jgi:hypothetical protein